MPENARLSKGMDAIESLALFLTKHNALYIVVMFGKNFL